MPDKKPSPPSLVVLYHDPFYKTERRLSYWLEVAPDTHRHVVIEEHMVDAHGSPVWYPYAGDREVTDCVLAYALRIALVDGTGTLTTTRVAGADVPLYDLRHSVIPMRMPI